MSDSKPFPCQAVQGGKEFTCPAGLTVPPGAVHARRRLLAAFAVLLLIGFVVTGSTLVLFSRSLAGIRGDFCAYGTGVYRATLKLPQVPARIAAERNDLRLMRELGCPLTRSNP